MKALILFVEGSSALFATTLRDCVTSTRSTSKALSLPLKQLFMLGFVRACLDSSRAVRAGARLGNGNHGNKCVGRARKVQWIKAASGPDPLNEVLFAWWEPRAVLTTANILRVRAEDGIKIQRQGISLKASILFVAGGFALLVTNLPSCFTFSLSRAGARLRNGNHGN